MFYEVLCYELEKLAVRMNGIHFSHFNSDKPRVRKQIRPLMRDVLRNNPFNKGLEYAHKKADLNGEFRSFLKKRTKYHTNKAADSITTHHLGGFSSPGSKRAAINMTNSASENGLTRRETIAHEAFHAKNYILGKSETLAHAYGGWRKTKGASLGQKVKDAAGSVGRYRRLKREGIVYK